MSKESGVLSEADYVSSHPPILKYPTQHDIVAGKIIIVAQYIGALATGLCDCEGAIFSLRTRIQKCNANHEQYHCTRFCSSTWTISALVEVTRLFSTNSDGNRKETGTLVKKQEAMRPSPTWAIRCSTCQGRGTNLPCARGCGTKDA